MRVRYTPRARKDLGSIRDYLLERSPTAAKAVIEAIRATIASVADHLLSGVQTHDAEVRLRLSRKYRYKIFYRVTSEIEILHVRHPARSPDWT